MPTLSTDPRSTGADYDFIVVGTGAGGGPLACNLARNGFRVLVVDAGGWDEPEVSQVPAFHPHASEHPDLSWEFFVKHYSTPPIPDTKWDAQKQGIFYPRVAAIGGCTVHNAMITICGPKQDWDHIASLTEDPSWAGSVMHRYFQRLERCGYVPRPETKHDSLLEKARDAVAGALGIHYDDNPGRHGFDGWLHTTMADPKLAATDPELFGEILAALGASHAEGLDGLAGLLKDFLDGRIRRHFDPNDWETLNKSPEGIALIPIAVRDGKRNGPRDYLRQVQKELPDRLVIQPETLVTEVLFDAAAGAGKTPSAIGIRFLRGKNLYRAHPSPSASPGEPGEVYCRREVILCGGAYNTPQLLKLSGIGPASELKEFGIGVRVDLPGVGTNLQDRYEVGVIAEMKHDFSLIKGLQLGPPGPGEAPDAALVEWRNKGTGLYASNAAVVGIFKKSRPDLAAPDLFIFALPGYFKGYYKGYSRDIAKSHNLLTWAVLKSHTKNRGGTVKLRSADPRDVPEINFHYFSEGTDEQQADLAAVVEGVKFVREINRRGMSKGVVKQELLPGAAAATDDSLKRFIEQEAWGHHASCSCPIGKDGDPMAVLDGQFRVRGVQNLRVVDASVFPEIPGYFIVSNVYMISEKASDVISAEHGKPSLA